MFEIFNLFHSYYRAWNYIGILWIYTKLKTRFISTKIETRIPYEQVEKNKFMFGKEFLLRTVSRANISCEHDIHIKYILFYFTYTDALQICI